MRGPFYLNNRGLILNTIFYLPKTYEVNSLLPIYIFSFLLFPLLIILSVKKIYFKNNKESKEVFDPESSLVLRGIATIMVMIHHYSLRLRPSDKMFYFWFVGVIAVAIFFFLSGYAAIFQLNKKADKFWDHYFVKRFIRLLLPFFITNTIYALLYMPSFPNYLEAMLTLKQIRGNHSEWAMIWFLAVILIFTILFYVSFRFTNSKKLGLCIFLGGSIIHVVVNAFILHSENHWFVSSLAYVTGIGFGLYKDSVSSFINRVKKYLFPIIIVIMAGTFLITTKSTQYWWLLLIYCQVFLLFLIIMEHCMMFRSPIFKRLGTASWEIFLIHPLIYSSYYSVFSDRFGLSGIICILIGIVLGLLINILDEKIFGIINNKILR